MNQKPSGCENDELLATVTSRIRQKIENYNCYSFTSDQDCALKTFFDLAQEFEGRYEFFLICVLIPKIFFQLNCRLFLLDPEGCFKLAYAFDSASLVEDERIIQMADATETCTSNNGRYRFQIRANMQQLGDLAGYHRNGILGIFEIESDTDLSNHMRFFFEKYVNRVGYQLHNRIISVKNKEHLEFIKNLVNDIGHNVIVPNMYFNLYYRRLKGKINRARAISEGMKMLTQATDLNARDKVLHQGLPLIDELKYVVESMETQFQEIVSHYEQTSLFLETLLRRSHFEEGRYVIEPKPINFREKIIRPQLVRFVPRLEERGISVDDKISGIPNEEIHVVADEGLISQAYANLFSNAEKYTREVVDGNGCTQKFVSVGMEILNNYFGPEKDGIKFNVFSTGPHLAPQDIPKIFDGGYRGENSAGEYGTGHGLQFIREVVELHNGNYGYEATPMGNNFFFILPR